MTFFDKKIDKKIDEHTVGEPTINEQTVDKKLSIALFYKRLINTKDN
jgi:hypothetical protein